MNKYQYKIEDLKPGMIVYTSWGYDQTNIDYYEIKEVKKASAVLQKIRAIKHETSFMSGPCIPQIGEYVGDSFLSRMSKYGCLSAGSIRGGYALWDGKPLTCSWYA